MTVSAIYRLFPGKIRFRMEVYQRENTLITLVPRPGSIYLIHCLFYISEGQKQKIILILFSLQLLEYGSLVRWRYTDRLWFEGSSYEYVCLQLLYVSFSQTADKQCFCYFTMVSDCFVFY